MSLFLLRLRRPRSTLFPYTTLFRSLQLVSGLGQIALGHGRRFLRVLELRSGQHTAVGQLFVSLEPGARVLERSEEHTSELQSHSDLVCRLLLEKKKQKRRTMQACYT